MDVYGNTQKTSAAFVGFDGIPFSIMADGSGMYGAWHAPVIVAQRHVPRSNRVYRQNMGQDLATITLTIEFNNMDDYRRFYAAYAAQKESRLTLLADFTLMRGEPHTIHRDYEHYDWVVIDRISEPGGGGIGVDRRPTCVATFAAAWDPQTMQVVD